MAWQDFAEYLAENRLSPTAYRVLFKLIGVMDYGNWVYHTQEDIARDLGIHPVQVSRAIKELKEMDLVYYVPIKPQSTRKVLRLNPEFVFKGSPKEEREAVRQYGAMIVRRAPQPS